MVKVDRFTIPVFFFSSEYRIFFLVSANLSPCHKTLEENPVYLPEPGSAELPITRKALLFDETIEQWIRSGAKLARFLRKENMSHNSLELFHVTIESDACSINFTEALFT